MDNEAFNQLLDRARRGETEAVLEACRQHQGLVLRADVNGWRLLHLACNGGHVELARGLLDLGAVVDARDNGGFDALMIASNNGHAAVVTLLLDRGADPCSRNDDYTALYFAAESDHLQVCLILLNRGADLMAVCASLFLGRTALADYGNFANPPPSNHIKEQRREQLRAAWAAGPHPSQVQRRRDERWARRWPFMFVLAGSVRPLAYRKALLLAAHPPVAPSAVIPAPVRRSRLTRAQLRRLHAVNVGLVLSNEGLVRLIASFI